MNATFLHCCSDVHGHFTLVDGTVWYRDDNDDKYIDAVRQKRSILTGVSVLRNRCALVQVPVMLRRLRHKSHTTFCAFVCEQEVCACVCFVSAMARAVGVVILSSGQILYQIFHDNVWGQI